MANYEKNAEKRFQKRSRQQVEAEKAMYQKKVDECDLELRKMLRLGDRILQGREIPAATGLEILALGGFLKYGLPGFVDNVQRAGRFAVNSYKTVADAVQGGPEGMRAAKTLEQEIEHLRQAAITNNEAAEVLKQYNAARKNFVTEILSVYNANESVSRECSRLLLNIKGMTKNIFDASNELKPDWVKENMDLPLMEYYVRAMQAAGSSEFKGLTMDEAKIKLIEKSQNIKHFYEVVDNFNKIRAKNEDTVSQFCAYLGKIQLNSEEQNRKIAEAFPKLINCVKEGYTVEDYLLSADSAITKRNVEAARDKANGLDSRVTETRTEVGHTIPLKEMPAYGWVDIVTSPFVMAAGVVFALKGLMHSAWLGGADKYISRAVCYIPKKIGNGISCIYEKLTEEKPKVESNVSS